MKKNYLFRTFVVTSIVIILLLIAYFFTPIEFGSFPIKKIDILSDIRKTKTDSIQQKDKEEDSKIPATADDTQWIDSCGIHYTCIEDFTADFSSMRHFYSVLDSISFLDRPVRVAFFGDSFIESDIITADVREQLQAIYGGCGVGYMPLSSIAAGYRKSIYHGFQNFAVSSLVKSQADLGVAGYGFKANEGATVFYRGVDYKKGLHDFSVVRLLYEGKPYIFSSYSINQGKVTPFELNPGPGVHSVSLNDSVIHSIAMTFSPGMLLYGVYLDCEQGIAVDNFAVRGHSGMNLINVSDAMYAETNKLVPYDLIVLQYGLNVAGANTQNYENYKKKMLENVAHLKKSFPKASFILMSVGDRGMRNQGNYITMPGILNLIPIQQEIAAESGIAFWNLLNAMGGESSMHNFVTAQPPMAAKDYTHLTHEGGKKIATSFVDALLYGKRWYDAANK